MTTTNEAEAEPKRRALICGIGGQDGAYLARFLLFKGYEAVGIPRDAANTQRNGGLRRVGVDAPIGAGSVTQNDLRSVEMCGAVGPTTTQRA